MGSLVYASAPPDPWVRIQSANFELFTTAGERAGRDLVRHFEEIRAFFLSAVGMQADNQKPVRIVAFHNDKEFRPYAPSEAAAAFYHDGNEHDYIVMSSTAPEHYQVATHEYTHLLVAGTGGTVPLWLNEGLADLYSTIERVGDKMLVGKAPPGRTLLLRMERWIPLETIVAVATDSPLYNEKSRAGMFYAESWALVHMLNLDRDYRAHLSSLLDALKTVDSAAAFEQAYGKDLAQVQADLGKYVRREYLHGVAFDAPDAKAMEPPEVDPNSAFAARLALAEMVTDYPGKIPMAGEVYSQLAIEFPQRWEVEAALGRLDWRERRNSEAVSHFARAAELGASDPRMFLDYARALNVTGHTDEALAPLRKALGLDASSKDAHYELGLALVRTGAWQDAIAELQLARPLKPQQAPHYFYSMAYSEFRLGDAIAARNYLEQGRGFIKIPEEVSALDQLSRSLGPPVVEGVLESIECKGNAASLHLRVGESARTFLISDFSLAKDLQCGPQSNVAVRIVFVAMPLGATGADGIVRSLEVK